MIVLIDFNGIFDQVNTDQFQNYSFLLEIQTESASAPTQFGSNDLDSFLMYLVSSFIPSSCVTSLAFGKLASLMYMVIESLEMFCVSTSAAWHYFFQCPLLSMIT